MRIGLTFTATAIVMICVAVGIAGYLAYRTQNPPPAAPQAPTMANIGKFTAVSPPLPAPDAAYQGWDGTEKHLADFRGHWLLLNLWATWCAPCIKEMPSLARMQAKLGSAIDVVAISEDRNGAKAVEAFLADHAVSPLAIGLDPKGNLTGALHIDGLPTSLLFDPQGRLVAKLEGAAEWDQGSTLAALRDLLPSQKP